MKRPFRILKHEENATDTALAQKAWRERILAYGSKRADATRICSCRLEPHPPPDEKRTSTAQTFFLSGRVQCLMLALFCSCRLNGSAQEPTVEKPPLSYSTHGVFSSTPLDQRTGPEILRHRVFYYTTNYFTVNNLVGPLQEGLQQRATYSAILGQPMANLLKSAGREAAREIVLRNMRIDDVLDSMFSDTLRDTIYYSLLDRRDRGTLRDPFNPSEGIPGFERTEPGRFPQHSNLQLHPFRTNPNVEETIHTSAIDIMVRASAKDAGVFTAIPLTASWVLTQGLKCEHYNDRTIHASFGVSKIIQNGYFSAGIRLPVLTNASPENHLQLIVGFEKHF